ncbi:MAG: hypothetical protein CL912_31355 [Deltaproteobacteria bacterium]|nr:hypothetical protein [Deltaproteobacteria bacterium]
MSALLDSWRSISGKQSDPFATTEGDQTLQQISRLPRDYSSPLDFVVSKKGFLRRAFFQYR